MTRTTIAAAGAVAALASAGAVLASDGGAAASARGTLVLTAKLDPTSVHTEDVGPAGPSAGDVTAFSAELRRSGRAAGRMQGVTTATDPRYEGDVKTLYLVLRRGTIAVVGGGTNKRPPGIGAQPDAIAGGTGAYAGAKGSVTLRDIDDTTLRIRLRFTR